jgi:hypothetical protein
MKASEQEELTPYQAQKEGQVRTLNESQQAMGTNSLLSTSTKADKSEL